MNYKDLENNMQQKLQNHEIKMDTDQLVADLFGKKKRKLPVALWFVSGVAFLLAAVGAYFFFTTTGSSRQMKPSPAELSDKKAMIDRKQIDKVGVDKIVPVSNSSNKISTSTLDIGEALVGQKLIKENSIINADKVQSRGISKRLDSNASTYSSQKLQTKYFVTKSPTGPNQDLALLAIESSDEAAQNLKTSLISLDKLSNNHSTVLLSANQEDPIKNLFPGVKCPSFKAKKPIKFSLIPEIGYFYPLTTFKSISPMSSEVLDIRKRNETTLEGIQAALYGKVGWKTIPWYFKTGLNYGRITRKMDLDLSFVRQDTTIGIISITESQSGDTLTVVRGPIITDTKVTRKEIRHYYHHLWSIPLVVGYQKNYEFFSWAVEAGININMSSKQTGFVMTAPDQFGLVGNSGLYKNKLGISYLAQIQVGRFINENNILAVALRANVNPNNFANNASTIDEKYQMIGINLMYEFRF